MRVESDRECKSSLGGWLHPLNGAAQDFISKPLPPPEPPRPPVFFTEAWKMYRRETTPKKVLGLADRLGVEGYALDCIGAAWSANSQAWAFPMRDGNGTMTGIRLRNEQSDKWAVKGSKQGLFLPPMRGMTVQVLWIVEGPTDTAAAITLGLHVCGRPCCQGCEQAVIILIHRLKVRRVVVCADNDAPGLRGAEKLQASLPVPSVLITTAMKDLREFLKAGGTRDVLESQVNDMVWRQPGEDFHNEKVLAETRTRH